MRVPERVAAFRDEYRRTKIGRFYSGRAHLLFTSSASLAVIGLASSRVRDPRAVEWLVVPITFLFANVAEYFGHKGPMHRPRAGLRLLFQRHTREHHHFFTHEAMAYASWRDVKMVLFPPLMLFFFLGVLAAPVAAAAFVLISPNAGWLMVATMMSYFLTYEWLHFAYHLDERSLLGRLPVLAILRRHHMAHHDQALMGRWNFNITFPICDYVFGTKYGRLARHGAGEALRDEA
jgi:Fatty acid hydroxylase